MEKNKKNRWQINKLGLVNFWYYDYEEIPLQNGKLLLRGGNGSGKSVTLQSFIPLLLDGNRAPRRLDPFGTVSRKLDNYMLVREGENERTAYLFLEFKKTDTENYITVGMGIKAQKNKETDIWYFIIRDGKRIGQEILLKKKEQGHDVVLQKKQLKNILVESGEFFDRQKNYMARMNEIFFGFDSIEYYEELLSLIINIRAPKLSKDFKPTKMYEILNDSLKTLDKEDLDSIAEPMAELDSIKNQIEDAKKAQFSAQEIDTIFTEYNKIQLFNKKRRYEENRVQVDKNLSDLTNFEEEIRKTEEKLFILEKEKLDLEIKNQQIKDRKTILQREDNFSKYEEKIRIEEEIDSLETSIHKKQEKIFDKKSISRKKIDEISKTSKEMEEGIEEIKRFKEELSTELNYLQISPLHTPQQLKIQLENLKFLLNSVRKDIRDYEDLKQRFKSLEEILEENQFKIDSKAKEGLRLENLLIEVVEEYKDNFLSWQENCKVLKFSEKEIIELNELLNICIEENKVGDVEKYIENISNVYERKLQLDLERTTLNLENKKNVERLKKKDVPFDNLQHILGLDILLIPEKYREEALNLKGEQYGNFIFTDLPFEKNENGYYKVGNLEGKINPKSNVLTQEEIEALIVLFQHEKNILPSLNDLKTGKETLEEHEKNLLELNRNKENLRNDLNIFSEKIAVLDGKLYLKLKDTPIEKSSNSLEILTEKRENAYEFLLESNTLERDKEIKTSRINVLSEEVEGIELELEELYEEIKKLIKKKEIKRGFLETLEESLKFVNIDALEKEIRELEKLEKELPLQIASHSESIGEYKNKKRTEISSLEEKRFALKMNQQSLKERETFYHEELNLGYVDENEFENFVPSSGITSKRLETELRECINKHSNILNHYKIRSKLLFSDKEDSERIDYIFTANRKENSLFYLSSYLEDEIKELELFITEKDRKIFEDILLENLSQKILAMIHNSKKWIGEINKLMSTMESSSSLKLDLKWEAKKSESEYELGTSEIVEILNTADRITENQKKRFSTHFLQKIKKALHTSQSEGNDISYHNILKEILDFRKWYEFRLFYVKRNEKRREMTDNNFFQLSGGEKAISMYLPLLAALYVRYEYASEAAPRIVAMDEAFAGVDEKNIGMLFEHLERLDLDYVLNSQILWGDYETIPELGICEIIREENDENIALINYRWNGRSREQVENV